jgi:DNA-binding transcriptional LysR family regulator
VALAKGLSATRIVDEPVWIALRDNDPMADVKGPIDLGGLALRDWVVPHRQWSFFEMVERACGAAGFVPRIVAEATDFAVLLSLVAAGAGAALVPQLLN